MGRDPERGGIQEWGGIQGWGGILDGEIGKELLQEKHLIRSEPSFPYIAGGKVFLPLFGRWQGGGASHEGGADVYGVGVLLARAKGAQTITSGSHVTS